jgi:uncharacterized protein YegL
MPTGKQVFPCYILCDESGLMDSNGGVTAINQALTDLHREIAADPFLSDTFRIGLITFSNTAEELMSLAHLSDVVAMAVIQARGVTNYGPVFDLLKRVISRDIASLKSEGFEVFRPLVLFLTSGVPADDPGWRDSYRLLMNKATFRQYPNIVAVGFAGADEQVIAEVGSVAAMIIDVQSGGSLDLASVVRGVCDWFLRAAYMNSAISVKMLGARNIEMRST